MLSKFRRLYVQHAGTKTFGAVIADRDYTCACIDGWLQRYDIVTQDRGANTGAISPTRPTRSNTSACIRRMHPSN